MQAANNSNPKKYENFEGTMGSADSDIAEMSEKNDTFPSMY